MVYNSFYFGSLAHLKNKNNKNRWFMCAFLKILSRYFKNMIDDIKNLRIDILFVNLILLKVEIISSMMVYKFFNQYKRGIK
jgi:hypothetical protein